MDELLSYLLDSLLEARFNVADCLDNDIHVNDLEDVQDYLLKSVAIVEGLVRVVPEAVDRQLKFPIDDSSEEEE